MAKALKVVGKVASIAATVLAFIPGGQPFAAAASAISAIATVGSQLLERPEPLGGSPSKTLIDTTSPTPYIMGRFRSGGVLVHDVAHGADYKKIPNPNRTMVFVHSDCGPVQEIEGLNTDGSFITSNGFAGGYYGQSLGVSKQLGNFRESTALSGLNGVIPQWGSAYKLSGKAATLVSLRWDKNQKKFQGGLPDITSDIRGVKVYSARDDSTYPGGFGDCRIDDEDTYIYSVNPSDHAVTYCYGRYRVNKKLFGVGLPLSGLDLPAYVEWANVCEANGWEVNGRIFEPADKWNNFKLILEAGSARPAHNSGKLSVSFDAPKISLATYTIEDLADGDIEIPATQGIRDRINEVVPRYMSPSHNWEYVAGSAVTSPQYKSTDGEDFRVEYQYSLVTNSLQAAQLAGYDLVNARELNNIQMTFKPLIRVIPCGAAITLDMPDLGLQGLFQLYSKSFNPINMTYDVLLRSLSTGRDAFALGSTTTPPQVPSLRFGEDYDNLSSAFNGRDLLQSARIAQSWTRDLIITGNPDGSILITDHERVYPNQTIEIIGGTLTGNSLGALYYLFYDDEDNENLDGSTSPLTQTYIATTVQEEALTSEQTPFRHFVGYVTLPETSSSAANTGFPSVSPTIVPTTVPSADRVGGFTPEQLVTDLGQVAVPDIESLAESLLSTVLRVDELRTNLGRLGVVDGRNFGTVFRQTQDIAQTATEEIVRVENVLAAAVEQSQAAITEESIARATALQAVASQASVLSSQIRNAQSSISLLNRTQADDRAASAEQVRTLRASVEQSNSAFVQQIQTLASADRAEASSRQLLEATVRGVQSSIVTQDQVIAEQGRAAASQRAVLQ